MSETSETPDTGPEEEAQGALPSWMPGDLGEDGAAAAPPEGEDAAVEAADVADAEDLEVEAAPDGDAAGEAPQDPPEDAPDCDAAAEAGADDDTGDPGDEITAEDPPDAEAAADADVAAEADEGAAEAGVEAADEAADELADDGLMDADDALDAAAADAADAEEELDADAAAPADAEADPEAAPAIDGAPLTIELADRIRAPDAEELAETLRGAVGASELIFDAQAVEEIGAAAIACIVATLKAREDISPPAAILSPSPAFVDAFSDLGLFQDLMKMEFRQ